MYIPQWSIHTIFENLYVIDVPTNIEGDECFQPTSNTKVFGTSLPETMRPNGSLNIQLEMGTLLNEEGKQPVKVSRIL